MAKRGGYTGPYYYSGADFYIHQHVENIGRANKGRSKTDNSLYKTFYSQRKNALQASKNRYKQLMTQSLSKDSLALVNACFEKDSDDLLTDLDEQIRTKLEASLDIENLRNLMTQQRSLDSKLGEKLLNSDLKEAVKSFDQLLTTLAEASKLLKSKEDGEQLAIALTNQLSNIKGGLGSRQEMGTRLQQALEDFKNKSNGKVVDAKVDHIVKTINSLARALATGIASNKENITGSSIDRIINNNIFSSGFAEALIDMIEDSTEVSANNAIIDMLGTVPTDIEFTDEKGNVVGRGGGSYSGKADVKAKNLKMSITSNSNEFGGEIVLDVGLSNKFYKSQGFKGLDNKVIKDISSGSGGTLGEAFMALFGSPIHRYYAYNTMAHNDNLPKAREALTDLILVRQINRLFATRGGIKDFSQYILINGELVSIWELILYTEKNFLGKTHSESDKALSLSISKNDRAAMLEGVKIQDSAQRVMVVNRTINQTKIKAYIHVDKMIAARKKRKR
jgi:hypothetical protein